MMLASQRLKRRRLASRRRSASHVDAILRALRAVDPEAAEASLPVLMASKAFTALLWEALPEERLAHPFPTPGR
jgi:hypothetical protein